jgi:flavin-dependent dehydrogenase
MTTATASRRHDAIVMGGGLAGLTLALQLRARCPDIDVLVLERRRHPVPLARHKVGESTVEIGAHYFAEVLGLKRHLESAQLRKFGFRFFFSHGRRDFENVLELGASRPLPVPAYQIDRGLFENYLAEEAQRRGVRFVDGATIREAQVAGAAGGPHRVRWQRGDEAALDSEASWLIDACGRAGLLKKQHALERGNAHAVHAVWFRIAQRIRIDDWCADPAWRARCVTPTRWLSTNHLVGPGYWVWLIPLASGSHSVGIVADPRFHALEEMNTFERALEWLARNQPRLADELRPLAPKLQDFAFLRRFSHDCTQVFSEQRWALAGEAGRFLDPFYSPGSDFIAIGNTYITELIARDRAGQAFAAHAQVYDQLFKSYYDSTLALYVDQYGLFGDPEVLPAKVIWDYTYYWSILAQLACQQRLADITALSAMRSELMRCQQLNLGVQAMLREWSVRHTPRNEARNEARMIDQAAMPWFVELNRSLADRLDDAAFRSRLADGADRLLALALELLARAEAEVPGLPCTDLRAVLATSKVPAHPRPMLFDATVGHP